MPISVGALVDDACKHRLTLIGWQVPDDRVGIEVATEIGQLFDAIEVGIRQLARRDSQSPASAILHLPAPDAVDEL